MPDASTIDLQARIAELEQRLKDVERRTGDKGRMADIFQAFFPPEVKTHLKAARREQLMAARSFIDHWIERLEEHETPHGRESISVD
jgi:hypothetical protein